MDNIFITELFPGWLPKKTPNACKIINRALRKFGFSVGVFPPIHTGGMTSVEQRMNMFHLVESTLFHNVPGDIVELGCHTGMSAVVFQKVIDNCGENRTLHVYDSFEGLPEVKAEDEGTCFRSGGMATSERELIRNFESLGLKLPVIHKGWFDDTLPTELPKEISFAHLDGDLYDSIAVSLEHVYPRLSKGAVCLIDDYSDNKVFDSIEQAPGVKKACDEFFADKPETVSLLYGGFDSTHGYGAHGYIRKL